MTKLIINQPQKLPYPISSMEMESSSLNHSISGTILFSTVGRSDFGFDIFSLPLNNISSTTEHRLTDGISVNYNAQFTDDHRSIVFVSERTGSPQLYITQPEPKQHSTAAQNSRFHDRPTLHGDRLFFTSAHQPPDSLYKSWSAVYSTSLNHHHPNNNKINRITPSGAADFSPSISQSGNFLAVASYGSKPWGGEFHELHTRILVYSLTRPDEPVVVSDRGGWPTWFGDSTIYFHRMSDDGWWSIYSVEFSDTGPHPPPPPRRVTPPGVHVFTPAAIHQSNKIAVATRRKGKIHRHIEIFDVESGEFQPVTELVNPDLHHYNPFISPGSKLLGYHRFRGNPNPEPSTLKIPNLDPVASPFESLDMFRINGSFPSFSKNGDFVAYNPKLESNGGGVKIMKSDGSKRWTLIEGRIAFYNSWAPSSNGKHVIFTSLGPIFQPAGATVQVGRISFDASSLNPGRTGVDNLEVKIMTKEETGNNAFPACSPDGKWVVFRSGRSGHKNLYIMDADHGEVNGGNEVRQLTEGPWIDTMPNWSPDGKLIAFSSNRHDAGNPVTFGLYLVRPDGSGLRRLHVDGSSDVSMERINHVCFSPNGEWFLFTTNMGGVTADPVSFPNQFQPYGDLFIVKVDGTGLKRLTWNAYENGTPTWHPRKMVDIDFAHLSLNEDAKVDAEELKGQFQEPLWIT